MASQHHAGAPPASQAVRAAGRTGRHGRPSALRAAVHARLEEMRFRHGVLLMVTAGTVLVATVTLVTMALTGGRNKAPAEPPAADSSSATHPSSTGPTGHSPRSTRRPRTASSTVVGVPPSAPVPAPTARPEGQATTPAPVPSWWRRDRHWHGSPPPWWHHH